MRVLFRFSAGSERLGDLAQVARQLTADRVGQLTVKVAPNGTNYAQIIATAQFPYNAKAAVIQSRNANVNVRVNQNTTGSIALQSGGLIALVDINVQAGLLFYVNNPGASDAYIDVVLIG